MTNISKIITAMIIAILLAIILYLLDLRSENTENYSDSSLIWRGFEHEWIDRPHRVERLGNWIEQSHGEFPRNASLHHSAQAGASEDEARFETHYQTVNAKNVQFESKMEIIQLAGEEGNLYSDTWYGTLELNESSKIYDMCEVEVMINGFDLLRNDGTSVTQKIGDLDVKVYNASLIGGKIKYKIDVSWKLSCQSFECGPVGDRFNCPDAILPEVYCERQFYNYTLNLQTFFIGYDSCQIRADYHEPIEHNFEYDTFMFEPIDREIGDIGERQLGESYLGDDDFDSRAMGITGFSWHVEKDITTYERDWWIDLLTRGYSLTLDQAIRLYDFISRTDCIEGGEIIIDDDVPHMQSIEMWLDYLPDTADGQVQVEGRLLFEYRPDEALITFDDGLSVALNYGHSGSVSMSITPVSIYFLEAEISDCVTEGPTVLFPQCNSTRETEVEFANETFHDFNYSCLESL